MADVQSLTVEETTIEASKEDKARKAVKKAAKKALAVIGQGAARPAARPAVAVADGPDVTDTIYEQHVFVCTGGKYCPEVDGDGWGVLAALKKQVSKAGLAGQIRVNQTGCLDQCGHGPMVVIYPEAVWYGGVAPEDAEEIVREHLVGGRPVERLRYRNRPGKNKVPR